ncbi:SdrD B-like domain-containing protein [Cyanothece sp. BG0011]|uniref:SdrD B-like domain-containing protein n=1 Tax=Cyanothece sp. BG0011 TaxID=2082950 RepID=UPI000D1E03B9|nr:SdrD B-like domain-containing protein [Cyanothece sp. BG0011]
MVRQNGNTLAILNNTSLPQINGTVWNDLDNSGTQNNSEQGLSNWRVYLDQNQNNQWDANEQSTLTNSLGNYSFSGLNPQDNYYIAVEGFNGWQKNVSFGK